jgi:hypothetical protein
MPFISRAQQRYFHAHQGELERQGVNVKEWDDATDFSHLPERKNMKTEHVSLGHKGSFNVKKGALHKMLGIPEGEKIPASKLQPHASDSPLLRRRKASAKGFRSMAH